MIQNSVKERPILFSSAMVRAILEGRKTQTRRVIKHQPDASGLWPRGTAPGARPDDCPHGAVGDRLWVRESWRDGGNGKYLYRATPPDLQPPSGLKWKPSTHMPRRACRLMLEIAGIRVERLQDISEEDARDEGLEARVPDTVHTDMRYRAPFKCLWDTINGKRPGCSWQDNPWLWVIDFRKLEAHP